MIYKTRIGELDFSDDDFVFFENGIPGFENLTKFGLVDLPETRIVMQWLVSLEDSEIAFPLIDPWLIVGDYNFEIPQDVIDKLAIGNKEKCLILCVTNIPKGQPDKLTINLLAPVVINLENRKGMQIILQKYDYPLRYEACRKGIKE